MKGTNKITVTVEQSQKASSTSMDCTCQILYDTSLSNVGDSDCQCSDCLEANLNAYNQFKNQEDIRTHDTAKPQPQSYRSKNTTSVRHPTKYLSQQQPLQRHRSTEHPKSTVPKTKKWLQQPNTQKPEQDEQQLPLTRNEMTDSQLNDFLLITRNRTRKYLELRKKLQGDQKQQKNQLKDKIKKNLQLLKYTTQLIQDGNTQLPDKQHQTHPYKWNHSIYTCQCNGKRKINTPNHSCCRNIKIKQSLDTNMDKLQPEFAENRAQILSERVKRRQEIRVAKEKQLCQYDQCPNHHNRTKKNKIKKIQKKITQNAKKYYQQLKKTKQQKHQQQKTKQGKLRAIDLKSKQILTRTKKINDIDQSKTSFKLSIDHFDTFSQLREQNNKRKLKKDNEKIIETNLQKGGQLEQQLYEDINQDIDEEINQQRYHPRQNIILKRTTKAQAPQYRYQQQLYDRIAYDAQIKPPSNLTHLPKRPVQPPPQSNQKYQKQSQKTKNLSRGKQEKKKKNLEEEVQKKKKEIFEQYQKRNTNPKPKNKQIRQQYQQKIKQNKYTKSGTPIQVYDDPLIQQYEYRQQPLSKIMEKGDSMDVYKINVHGLKSKPKIKV